MAELCSKKIIMKPKWSNENIQNIPLDINRFQSLVEDSNNVSESDVTVIGCLVRIAQKFACEQSQHHLFDKEEERKQMEQSLIDISYLMIVIEEKLEHLSNISYLEYIISDVNTAIQGFNKKSKSITNGK